MKKVRKIYRKLKKYIKKAYRFATRKILYPIIYKLSSIKPIQEDKIVFMEARNAELSNSFLLLYQRLKDNYNFNIHCHFLRTGFVSEAENIKRCIDFVKDIGTAKYIVYQDGSDVAGAIKVRSETKILQTWHGCGAFKKFGFSTAELIFGDTPKGMKRYPSHADYDYVTVSSPEVVWAYVEAMGKENKPDCIKPVGVSRTDIFFDPEFVKQASNHLSKIFPFAEEKKIILYAPTFRGRVKSATTPDELNICLMYEQLHEDYVLIYKHHPLVKDRPIIPKKYQKFAIDLTQDMSIEELLCTADICISDYSSLIFEYSLFERPMIFFAFDLDEYFDWRGFYYDYDELTPGPVFTKTDQIVDYIKNIDEKFDKKQVQAFREKFMSACDGHATERILDMVFGTELNKFEKKTTEEIRNEL